MDHLNIHSFYDTFCQALRIVYTALTLVLSIVGSLLAPARTAGESYPFRSLVRISASRARVLCPTCHAENDDGFRFCQMCGDTVSNSGAALHRNAQMDIDEDAIRSRYAQFRAAWAEKASMKSRSATYVLFTKFLQSRSTGSTTRIEGTQPTDVVEFLCWLDSCGARRRTVVHARHCAAVGMKDFAACSTAPGECSLRYAFDSLRSNHISKLAMVFEKELGIVTPWSSTLRIGNPVRSELVSQYLAFSTEEQKQAGVLVKQAPAILHGHLEAIVRSMRAKLQNTASTLERVTLARDIAFLTVAFSTTKRGTELTHTLIQRVLRLPNKSGLLFNFQWGKTLRDGADHLISVPYDEKYVAVCPVRAVEQWIAVGRAVGWDMTSGYLFFEISTKDNEVPGRGSLPISAAKMSTKLKGYARAAGETQDFSLHSFRSGGAISRALAGDSLSTIMQRAYWKSPKTAWRYMRLLEVVAPGSEGIGTVEGVTSAQFAAFNEFPLSEQSRSWAAFSGKPLL